MGSTVPGMEFFESSETLLPPAFLSAQERDVSPWRDVARVRTCPWIAQLSCGAHKCASPFGALATITERCCASSHISLDRAVVVWSTQVCITLWGVGHNYF